NCIFCKIISGEIPGKFVYQDDKIVAFEDINQQAPHHVLIVPRKHIRTTLDLTTADNEMVGHIYQVAGKIAHDIGFAEDGFRIVNNCN
ncbi:MAG: HIT domain-containing protein, partial [Gammaproteobacteria bacterium]|nr:HIT domain-containing protein [Gammaproteobacteria bacterium]NIQ09020.1 HIT domain-containing protein [Gammaproteobacteria bacterium]NIR25877.1 HIT domain-containing protein [Gammaproteobacteria bacterium]NIX16819.1 HIT domain-containing protein [Gammaproteobacteria bacterium]NIY19037.1 HIT domain-containing protein [Gammaproteobacteria bacterium]